MRMLTSYELACRSPQWKDYSGEIMIAFDDICRKTKAVQYGVTYPGHGIHGAIFQIAGERNDVEVIASALRSRFPFCVFAIDPPNYKHFWMDKNDPVDAVFIKRG